jgi:hypothetical protein
LELLLFIPQIFKIVMPFVLYFKNYRGKDLFKQLPIRNKNCPWWPYLLVERNEMEKLYRGPYIDAYCQVWFHYWLMFKKSSLKPLGQMEPKLAGSIYVRSKPGIDGPWVCPFQNCVDLNINCPGCETDIFTLLLLV